MTFEPHFLEGSAGRLFSLYFPASRPRDAVPGVVPGIVYVPPFAEEMHQSRRMASLQARKFAEAGVAVLLLDPYGTGDSEGDFAEARWEIWLDDVDAALDWMQGQGHQLALWGLRLGALLAAEAAARRPQPLARLILWQPVLQGRRLLTQFLRLKVAAAMAEDGARVSTGDMLKSLEQGASLEIAGYELAPELALAIDRAALAEHLPAPETRVHWLEVGSAEPGAPPPATAKVLDAWQAAGVKTAYRGVKGQSFWLIQETTLVPALWDATLEAFAEAA
jgi:exosortase A-associated hydrolase 2